MSEKSFFFEKDYDKKIIYYKHTGKLERKDIGDAWRELMKMEEFVSGGFDLISDYSNADFLFTDFGTVNELFHKIANIINGKREAVVLKSENSTATSMLFLNGMDESLNFKVAIFNTLEEAIKWLS